MKTVNFTEMKNGTKEDYELLEKFEKNFERQTAERVLNYLSKQTTTLEGYKITRLEHSLQAATRAFKNKESDEMVVATLLHDIGDDLAPMNHSQYAASILRPYVSERTYWIILHHGLFQTYYSAHHLGGDRNARDKFKDYKYYQDTIDFCEKYDQCSFDPDYKSMSLDDFKPIPYKGENGIEKLLKILNENSGWSPIFEKNNIIGLLSDNKSSISLEPGGQLELSGAALKNLHMTCDETGTHLAQLRKALKKLNLGMAGFGFHPLSKREDFHFMPKGRYKIMRNWMPKVGSMGLDMMLRTCTIQVNLDYSSEKDMVKKFRTAITLQPVITALFSNSPFYEGEVSDFLSLRTEVWRNTDKARCGIPRCVFDHDFGYEKWGDYLVSVPL